MRNPQPTLRYRHRLPLLPDLQHVIAVGVDVAQREVQIHVLGRARHPELSGERTGDFGVLLERRRDKRKSASAAGGKRGRGRRGVAGMRRAARGIAPPGEHGRFGLRQRAGDAVAPGIRLGQVEVELGPLGARERPLVLVAEMVCAVTGADRQLDRRFLHHAVVDVLEPVVEEAKLVAPPILAVEGVIMRAAMDAQLLVLRGGAHVGLGGAAQVQPHAGPVTDRPHGKIDLIPLRLLALEYPAV